MIAKATHKKFANLKNYELLDDKGGSLGIFEINEKEVANEKKALKEFVEMTGAASAVLVWTALTGKCCEVITL